MNGQRRARDAGEVGRAPAALIASSGASLCLGGGREAAPAAAGWRRRLGERLRSPAFRWALKATGIVAVMAGLGAVGHVARTRAGSGVLVAERRAAPAALLGQAWLAPGDTKTAASAAPPALPPPPPSSSGAKAEQHPERAKAPVVPCRKPASGSARAASSGGSPGITADGKVILNLATAEELTRLPGVGAKRAEAIVRLRERLKRFRRPTDLLRVRGIGVRSLKRLTPHFVLDPEKAAPPPES